MVHLPWGYTQRWCTPMMAHAAAGFPCLFPFVSTAWFGKQWVIVTYLCAHMLIEFKAGLSLLLHSVRFRVMHV